jgi:hypothetical protein
VAGLSIIAGQLCFWWNLYKTWLLSRGVPAEEALEAV